MQRQNPPYDRSLKFQVRRFSTLMLDTAGTYHYLLCANTASGMFREVAVATRSKTARRDSGKQRRDFIGDRVSGSAIRLKIRFPLCSAQANTSTKGNECSGQRGDAPRIGRYVKDNELPGDRQQGDHQNRLDHEQYGCGEV